MAVPPLTVQKRYLMSYVPKLARSHQVALMELVCNSVDLDAPSEGEPQLAQIPKGVAIFLDRLDPSLVERMYNMVHSIVEHM